MFKNTIIVSVSMFLWPSSGICSSSYIHLFLWSGSPPYIFSMFAEWECLFSLHMFYVM
jgi:hypothetical protein